MEHEPLNQADPLDRAAAEGELALEDAMNQHRAASRSVLPEPTLDGSCTDCGDPVEEGRLRLRLGRCLACARDAEHDRNRRGMR